MLNKQGVDFKLDVLNKQGVDFKLEEPDKQGVDFKFDVLNFKLYNFILNKQLAVNNDELSKNCERYRNLPISIDLDMNVDRYRDPPCTRAA